MLHALLAAGLLSSSLGGVWHGTIGDNPVEFIFHDEGVKGTVEVRNPDLPWSNPGQARFEHQGPDIVLTLGRNTVRLKLELGSLVSEGEPKISVHPLPETPRIETIPFVVDAPGGKLSGSLIRPAGTSRVPAALLIPGRGGGRRMNLGMGIVFARRGMAFVSMDEPGTGESPGSLAQDTHAKKVERYTAVLDALLKREDIDPKRVGLVSSSAGGWTSPPIAASRPVAFWIGLVAPSESVIAQQRSSFQVLLDEVRPPLNADEMKEAQGFINAMLDVVAGKRRKEDVEALRQTLEGKRFAEAAEVPKAVFEDNVSWIGRFNFDPAEDIRKSKCKTLIILGGADPVVPPESNAKLYRELLGSRGEVVIAPGVGHGLTGSIEGRVQLSPEAQESVKRFVDAIVGPRA